MIFLEKYFATYLFKNDNFVDFLKKYVTIKMSESSDTYTKILELRTGIT